jgi:hypothetical protein
MFLSEHAIWQFANAGDELNDWLPYAEDLIRKWSDQNNEEVDFQTTFEIIIASLLLEDDLLPASARKAFAKVMLTTIDEADANKLKIKCLHVHPPKPGRKKNRTEAFIRLREVKSLIQEGTSPSRAYSVVATRHFKSHDTIRREYERLAKKNQKKNETGENDQ